MKKNNLFLILVYFLTLYAPVLVFSRENILAAFTFFTSDTYYYLAVARHSVNAPFFTFDGLYPTNGFHPL